MEAQAAATFKSTATHVEVVVSAGPASAPVSPARNRGQRKRGFAGFADAAV